MRVARVTAAALRRPVVHPAVRRRLSPMQMVGNRADPRQAERQDGHLQAQDGRGNRGQATVGSTSRWHGVKGTLLMLTAEDGAVSAKHLADVAEAPGSRTQPPRNAGSTRF